ncbi:DUF3800 domain-containing protein [Rhodococcus sp. IEGM 1408]|uniref:DUF3800 domain-containing protein n=1 Tax=Rhodococcus sp. IEGM 1408 TaxID=3082220 RepID=UPI00295552C9|nr:DUF3800 domain-containing protein [Rhodococcus sp. IEGM 1408]MDV8003120.1 DUF3800 domain-containing protein [Rhodococcus sp. IEGM 1408]
MDPVLIAYVDESYDQELYYVGAAIADYDQWEHLTQLYVEIGQLTADQHGTDASAEFHGHEIMGGAGQWAALRGKHREAAGLYSAVLRAAQQAGVRYLFEGVDVRRLNSRYRYPEQPHTVVFRHLLEQIDTYTARHGGDEQVIVVADEIATSAEHQDQFGAYQDFGTGGYRPSRLQHISAPINFADSAQTPGLQSVDMAVYIHHRANAVRNQHPRAQAVTDRLAQLIYQGTYRQRTWMP